MHMDRGLPGRRRLMYRFWRLPVPGEWGNSQRPFCTCGKSCCNCHSPLPWQPPRRGLRPGSDWRPGPFSFGGYTAWLRCVAFPGTGDRRWTGRGRGPRRPCSEAVFPPDGRRYNGPASEGSDLPPWGARPFSAGRSSRGAEQKGSRLRERTARSPPPTGSGPERKGARPAPSAGTGEAEDWVSSS